MKKNLVQLALNPFLCGTSKTRNPGFRSNTGSSNFSPFHYRKCPHSRGYCIRREFFCDGRVNCAWPDAEAGGTDEVLCDVEGMYSSDRL